MTNFFKNFAEDLKDEDTTIAADGQAASEFSGTIDSGSYLLNALLSGSSMVVFQIIRLQHLQVSLQQVRLSL